MVMKKSDFGRGLIYNLCLFVKHFENKKFTNLDRYKYLHENPEITRSKGEQDWLTISIHIYGSLEKAISDNVVVFMNAASDHLYEMEIPKFLPADLRKKIQRLKETSLDMGHGFKNKLYTYKDAVKLLDLALEISRNIDCYLTIPSKKGRWE